jgi:hypothetical protein
VLATCNNPDDKPYTMEIRSPLVPAGPRIAAAAVMVDPSRKSEASNYSQNIRPWADSSDSDVGGPNGQPGAINSAFSNVSRDGVELAQVGRQESKESLPDVKRTVSTVMANGILTSMTPLPAEIPEEWSCAYLGWFLTAFVLIFLGFMYFGGITSCTRKIQLVDTTYGFSDDAVHSSDHHAKQGASSIYAMSFNPDTFDGFICGSWIQNIADPNDTADDFYLNNFPLFDTPCLLPGISWEAYGGQKLAPIFRSGIQSKCDLFFSDVFHANDLFNQHTNSCITEVVKDDDTTNGTTTEHAYTDFRIPVPAVVSVAFLTCTSVFTTFANAM